MCLLLFHFCHFVYFSPVFFFLSIELTDTESPSGLVVQQAWPGLQHFSDDKWLIVASLKVASGFFCNSKRFSFAKSAANFDACPCVCARAVGVFHRDMCWIMFGWIGSSLNMDSEWWELLSTRKWLTCWKDVFLKEITWLWRFRCWSV